MQQELFFSTFNKIVLQLISKKDKSEAYSQAMWRIHVPLLTGWLFTQSAPRCGNERDTKTYNPRHLVNMQEARGASSRDDGMTCAGGGELCLLSGEVTSWLYGQLNISCKRYMRLWIIWNQHTRHRCSEMDIKIWEIEWLLKCGKWVWSPGERIQTKTEGQK